MVKIYSIRDKDKYFLLNYKLVENILLFSTSHCTTQSVQQHYTGIKTKECNREINMVNYCLDIFFIFFFNNTFQ